MVQVPGVTHPMAQVSFHPSQKTQMSDIRIPDVVGVVVGAVGVNRYYSLSAPLSDKQNLLHVYQKTKTAEH